MNPSKVIASVLATSIFSIGLGVGANKIWFIDKARDLRNFVRGSAPEHPKKPRVTLFENFAPPSQVVMVGDSLTEGGLWNEFFPNVSIANRGVSGDTSQDVLQRIDTTLKLRPKRAFVMFGINDIYAGVPDDQLLANYRGVIKQLKGTGSEVFIQSTIECSRSTCFDKLSRIRELNAELQILAREENLKFLDINPAITSKEQGLLPQYTFDGTHLLGSGYKEWTRVISSAVNGDN